MQIDRTNRHYHYISNSDDNEHRKHVPNLTLVRLLYKFKGVRTLRCHGKVNVVEILKFIELSYDTVVELDIGEANVDFTKLFKKIQIKPGSLIRTALMQQGQVKPVWKSANLRVLRLTDIR